MRTDRQRLRNQFTAPETSLRSEARRHSHHLAGGSRSLLRQQREKRTPTRILNALGQTKVAAHPPHTQVFHTEAGVPIHIGTGRLVQEVPTLTGDLQMGLGDVAGCLVPSPTALLATAERPLLPAKRLLGHSIPTRVLDRVALAVGQQDLQSHILRRPPPRQAEDKPERRRRGGHTNDHPPEGPDSRSSAFPPAVGA